VRGTQTPRRPSRKGGKETTGTSRARDGQLDSAWVRAGSRGIRGLARFSRVAVLDRAGSFAFLRSSSPPAASRSSSASRVVMDHILPMHRAPWPLAGHRAGEIPSCRPRRARLHFLTRVSHVGFNLRGTTLCLREVAPKRADKERTCGTSFSDDSSPSGGHLPERARRAEWERPGGGRGMTGTPALP
jgi:hypothetical protein